MANSQRLVYTIGHSNRSIDEFIELLGSVGVRILVDVRAYPTSRRYPQFDINSLRSALANTDIIYHWAGRNLGGFRQNRPDSRHVSLTGSMCAYADHMARIVLTCIARIVPDNPVHFLRPCRSDALMSRTQDALERPDNPLHFLHLDNCSCVVLPSDIPGGRLEVRHPNSKERPIN